MVTTPSTAAATSDTRPPEPDPIRVPLRVAPLAEGMHRDYGSMLFTQAQFIAAFVLVPALFIAIVLFFPRGLLGVIRRKTEA